jgi:hypothetical protein
MTIAKILASQRLITIGLSPLAMNKMIARTASPSAAHTQPDVHGFRQTNLVELAAWTGISNRARELKTRGINAPNISAPAINIPPATACLSPSSGASRRVPSNMNWPPYTRNSDITTAINQRQFVCLD